MPVSSLVVATCILKSWLVASDLAELLDIFDIDMKKCQRKILDAIFIFKRGSSVYVCVYIYF